MKILVILLVIVVIAFLIKKVIKNKEKNMGLREIVKKTFPKHTIIEKNNQIMICEINHRNEPDERIFIRTGRRKKIEKSGRFIIAEYSKKPTGKELKNDLTKYL